MILHSNGERQLINKYIICQVVKVLEKNSKASKVKERGRRWGDAVYSVIREATYGRVSLRTPKGRGEEAFGSLEEEVAGRGNCKGKVPRVE